MKKLGLALGIALACASGYALGQSGLTSQTLTGNETWAVGIGGPQGPSIFTTVAQMRNSTAVKIFPTASGAQVYTALPTDSVLYWNGTAPTSWTITTPANPWDGQMIQIATDTTLTTRVTLTANTGQTLNATFTNQTINGSSSVEFVFNAATAKWFQMR